MRGLAALVLPLYTFNTYIKGADMPRAFIEDNSRLAFRVRAEDKATLMRAVAIEHTDMTDFILRHALDAARKVIEQSETVTLSARDSLRVLDVLENPPVPNAKLQHAASRMSKHA